MSLDAPYVFESGLAMTEPVPNRIDSWALYVFDCRRGGGFFGLCTEAPESPPDGSGFLGAANFGLFFDVELTLPAPVRRVRTRMTSRDGEESDFATMTAFDESGEAVDSTTVHSMELSSWADNVMEVQADAPVIRTVVLTSDGAGSLAFDLFEWE